MGNGIAGVTAGSEGGRVGGVTRPGDGKSGSGASVEVEIGTDAFALGIGTMSAAPMGGALVCSSSSRGASSSKGEVMGTVDVGERVGERVSTSFGPSEG